MFIEFKLIFSLLLDIQKLLLKKKNKKDIIQIIKINIPPSIEKNIIARFFFFFTANTIPSIKSTSITSSTLANIINKIKRTIFAKSSPIKAIVCTS